jgi:glycosyltransferase involved in cell wall biosynthesis
MTHTNSQTIQYVTAFYEINTKSKREEIIENFKPFLLTERMKILIFTDDTKLQEDLSGVSHIQIVHVPRTELFAFQCESDIILPTSRDSMKDTVDFLSLMNAKSEFIYRASSLAQADVYVWFDMGILKICKHKESFLKTLESRFEPFACRHRDKIIMPGCVEKEKVLYYQMFSAPIWRFCGGIFCVPSNLASKFFDLHKEELQVAKILNTFTWEVNLFASIEQKTPELFLWYPADHNDSIIHVPDETDGRREKLSQKRVIILSMIKNETKVIRRMVDATLGIADAVCICDTGSTDNTVEVLQDYFKTLSVPGKIYNSEEHLWKNFGYNRSQSFLAAVDFCKELGWSLEDTYAIALDADMQLQVTDQFSKQELTSIGYKIIQRAGSLEYYNVRFLKLSHPWKCSGVTHEYWDGGETDILYPDKIFIQDIGDGGCKDDKFERDIRLLEQGLIDEPNNPRYFFYLAQTYKDINSDKSIEYYLKRIQAGGWYEEIWYSMYQLMKIFEAKKDYPEMEKWGVRAYEFSNSRMENIYALCKHFRDRRQHFKAWHYLQLGIDKPRPNDLLFVETDCYGKCFEYERAILHDYVYPEKKTQSMRYSLDYFNKYNEHFAYDNIQWFVTKIPGTIKIFHFQDIGDYKPTSTSFVRLQNGMYRVNVRYVNYRIQPDGSYLMSKDGVLSRDHAVCTDNYTCLMDENFGLVSPLEKMNVETQPVRDVYIQGLEDVRLYQDKQNILRYIATTMNYASSGSIRQVIGRYDAENHIQSRPTEIISPTDADCEKNWIPYDGDRIIYSWHPFRSGRLNNEGKLEFDVIQQTPHFLQHMRGSSTLVLDGGYFYGITHCVIYSQPRKYYHMVVRINANTHRLEAYTYPFFFQNNAIEYCLGYEKHGDEHIAFVSQNDCNPIMVRFKDSDLLWQTI